MRRAGEITAADLYARHLDDVYRYVWQRVPSVADAEDITAEVFAAAAAGIARFRGECPPYLWLLSIARRQIALAHRRRAVRKETLASDLAVTAAEAASFWESLAAVEGPERALIEAEARRVFRALVAELKPDQREALMLHTMERLSATEIAIVMGRSPGAVYQLLHRARTTLYRRGRAYFSDDDEGARR